MSPPRPKTARAIAAQVLSRTDPRKDNVTDILSDFLRRTTETQRATDLVFGVIKNRSLIDMLIAKVSDCPPERIPAKILNILRAAVYELLYCPRTARHAIVAEAVEYAKSVTNKKQAGFVNAVLRQTTRHITNREKPLNLAEPRNTIPHSTLTGCELDISLFPDPEESPVGYLAFAFSLPRWLVNGWLEAYGPEQTRQICFASNRRPSVYIRPNTLKTTAQKLAEKLRADGIECEPVGESQMIKLKRAKAIDKLPGFSDGLFTVQDLAASQVVRFLNPRPDWTILDLCAAPGTKTTQLAEAAQNKARIFATDIDPNRLEKVRENLDRLRLTDSIAVIDYAHLDKLADSTGPFDAILVDVPCSNTGVLAKRPEVRHRITKSALDNLSRIQLGLLETAAKMLKPNGDICYSTCSAQPQENNLLVAQFLKGNPGFKLKEEKLILPSAQEPDHDGTYAAVIIRK